MSERAIEAAAATIFCHAQFNGDDYTARQLARAALAAADRVGIKSLNEEAAEGTHFDLDYRPDPAERQQAFNAVEQLKQFRKEHPAERVAGEDANEQLRAALQKCVSVFEQLADAGNYPLPLYQNGGWKFALDALALSPGKVSDEKFAEAVGALARVLEWWDALPANLRQDIEGSGAEPGAIRHARNAMYGVSPGKVEGWNEAIEACIAAQPCTAEKPTENAYCKGHFDGVMDYGRAIRNLRRPSPPISSRAEDS